MGVLEGKVAVVTGGASGIGAASALHCAAAGARVVIADIQDARGVVSVARARDQEIGFLRTDVSSSSEVAELMQSVVAQLGRLDVLVAAAGISGGTASTKDYPEI